MPWRSLRALSQALVSRRLDLTVAGLEHLPRSGPAIIAARHYHHLYDGAALLAVVPRPLRILVASDWATPGPQRMMLEAACRAAGWPVVRRAGSRNPARPVAAGDRRHLLRAVRQSVEILAGGGLLLVFPEGYPTIDPGYTAKTGPDEFLPFEPGFARIAAIAAHRTGHPLPVIPAGFWYQPGPRWRTALRFGPPLTISADLHPDPIIQAIEHDVQRLSQSPDHDLSGVDIARVTGRAADPSS